MALYIAAVRTGCKYSTDYVYRLRDGVARYLPVAHKFVCLTDRPQDLRDIATVETDPELPGWWGKMKLFDPSWRVGNRVLYFDLDSVIVGDLTALANVRAWFAICANFSRAAGLNTPCRYGSCVMSIGPGFGQEIFDSFAAQRDWWMSKAGRYGDQWVIESLYPFAPLLQDLLPAGFFVGYRDLPKHRISPDGCSVVIFAGNQKPDNTKCKWARTAWAA